MPIFPRAVRPAHHDECAVERAATEMSALVMLLQGGPRGQAARSQVADLGTLVRIAIVDDRSHAHLERILYGLVAVDRAGCGREYRRERRIDASAVEQEDIDVRRWVELPERGHRYVAQPRLN